MMAICLQCKRPLSEDDQTVNVFWGEWMKFFCSASCRDEFVYPKLINRMCAREGCNGLVPEANKMLCLRCYCDGDNLGERFPFFDMTDNAHLEQQEQAIRKRIEVKVRVFSSQYMTQEELRALVPSLADSCA